MSFRPDRSRGPLSPLRTLSRAALQTGWLAALALLIGIGPAQALPISTSVESSGASSNLTDDDTSASSGTISSTVIDTNGFGAGFSGPASARAIQDSSGNGAVSVEGLFAGGTPGRLLSANAVFEETVTNTASVAQGLTFSFNIAAITLQLFGVNNFGVVLTHTSSYDILITQDGSPIFLSGADFVGLDQDVALFEDSDTNPLATDLGGVVTMGSSAMATFAAFSDSIDLGMLGPGASTTLVYSMTAAFFGPEFESGGAASVGDPLDFAQTPGVAATFELVQVPEPASASLALMGLASGFLGRRR